MATPNKDNPSAPVVSPLGGIPAPGQETAQPLSDVHPDITPAQELDVQTNAPNETVQTETPSAEPKTTETQAPDASKSDDIDFTKYLELEGSQPVINPTVKTPEVKSTTPVTTQPTPEARDYTPYETIFGKDKIDNFKKMGNEAFNTLTPIIKEHAQTKEALKAKEEEIARLKEGRVPDNYYENEKAFVLTPDYQEAESVANQAEAIAAHWERQLAKVRGGDDTYQSLAYNDKGEIVTTEPIKIDPKAEAIIMRAMVTTQNQATQAKAALAGIQQTFLSKHKEAIGRLRDFESKAFAAFDKPEYKPIVEDTIRKILPAPFHNNPLATAFAKLFLVNTSLVGRIKTAGQAQQKTTQTATNGKTTSPDSRAAGPQPNLGVQGAGTVKTSSAGDVTFEDFENRINGL